MTSSPFARTTASLRVHARTVSYCSLVRRSRVRRSVLSRFSRHRSRSSRVAASLFQKPETIENRTHRRARVHRGHARAVLARARVRANRGHPSARAAPPAPSRGRRSRASRVPFAAAASADPAASLGLDGGAYARELDVALDAVRLASALCQEVQAQLMRMDEQAETKDDRSLVARRLRGASRHRVVRLNAFEGVDGDVMRWNNISK